MRIGLFSPYLREHTGGGERYMLSVAHCLERDHQVDLIVDCPTWQLDTIRERLEKALNIALHKAKFVSGPFGGKGSFLDRLFFTSQYDVFYYLTDGSFFLSQARVNLVHIQVPLASPLKSYLSRLRFTPWKIRIANSEFTKRNIERRWDIPVQYVHRVPVQIQAFTPGKKEKVILSVGRFFTGLHEKKHYVLVEAFRMLFKQGYKDWSLILAGSLDPGESNKRYVEELRILAKNLPVTLAVDVPFAQLRDLYAKASFYWHAAGFGEDERVNPEKFEHFGITTVEAMASGCVPIVVNRGGQLEIIKEGVNGFGYEKVEELVQKTKALIEKPGEKIVVAKRARVDSKQFSEEEGCKTLQKILGEIA